MGTYGAHFFISGQTTGSAIEFGVGRQSNTTGDGVLYLRQDLAENTGRGLGAQSVISWGNYRTELGRMAKATQFGGRE